MGKRLSFNPFGAIIGAGISIVPLWAITLLACPGLCDSPGWVASFKLVCGLTLLIGAFVGGKAAQQSVSLWAVLGLMVGIVTLMLHFNFAL